MYTVTQRLRIAASWLASYVRSDWRPEHYPIHLRRQQEVSPEVTWVASVLNWPGPIGVGSTAEGARRSLHEKLQRIAAERARTTQQMPRPGVAVPLQFASTSRIEADPALLHDFLEFVLGFAEDDPVFVSDSTNLSDFDDEEEIRDRIRERYGIVIAESAPLLADVLERIRAGIREQ